MTLFPLAFLILLVCLCVSVVKVPDFMQNIEFKAELRDLQLAYTLARRLGARHVGQLWQIDTYYRLVDGRLKKRETEGSPVEYIFYQRENEAQVRQSTFTIYTENEARARFGRLEWHPWIVVRKTRDVFMLGHVRIHLDQVDRLGTFIEFEALVSDQNDQAKCHAALQKLRREFAPVVGEMLSLSYSDLLALEPEIPPAAGPVA